MSGRGTFTAAVAAGVLMLTVAASLQDRFPDAPGKPELLKVCGSCHDAEIVLSTLQTPAEWADTLQIMAQQGAEATPDAWRLIGRYIDSNFALIRVNKATASEIERTLDVTPAVAEAVVKQRQADGPFRSIDDVKKVEGVDATKVDARKSRFVF